MTVTTVTEQSLPLVKVRAGCPGGYSQKESFPGWVLLMAPYRARAAREHGPSGWTPMDSTLSVRHRGWTGRLNLEEVLHQAEAQMKHVTIMLSLEKSLQGPLDG